MAGQLVSVVTSLYGSSPYVYEFYHRARSAIEKCGLQYEFVFVDDGSPDDSAAVVARLRAEDPRVHLIRLSRNQGQQTAMLAGMEHCHGDLVFALDVDLEEKPEDFGVLLEAMQRENADVAYGVMTSRQGGFVRKSLGQIFHRAMGRLSSISVPENQMWARVMTRRYLNAVCRYTEKHLYLGGIFQLVGFRQVQVRLEKTFKRSTSYGFWKRTRAALDALTSFSEAPLYALCGFGLVILAICAVLAAAILVQWLLFGNLVEGWTTLALMLLSFMGVTVFTQGVLGIYLGKVFAQVKQRPRYQVESSTFAESPVTRTMRNLPTEHINP